MVTAEELRLAKGISRYKRYPDSFWRRKELVGQQCATYGSIDVQIRPGTSSVNKEGKELRRGRFSIDLNVWATTTQMGN